MFIEAYEQLCGALLGFILFYDSLVVNRELRNGKVAGICMISVYIWATRWIHSLERKQLG